MLDDFKRYWHNEGDAPLFLLDQHDEDERRRHRLAAAGSIVAEIVLVGLALVIPNPPPRFDNGPRVQLDYRRTTLVAPPKEVMEQFKLTQKTPQTTKPATEVNLAQLLPKPELQPSPRPARGGGGSPGQKAFVPPTPPSPPPAPQMAKIDIPRIELPAQGQQSLPEGTGTQQPAAAPPPEKPKLMFESVGGAGRTDGSASGITRLDPPKVSVEDAMRAVARAPVTRSQSVGDMGSGSSGGVGEMLRQNATPGQRQSKLELLSDPQGVDFKPYLAQVLAAVKRNWLNVLPESARYGQRGQVTVQFIVGKNGFVPKLVIAVPSGTQALDRASVAGISASVPFPPLPAEFHGSEVRLQLIFTYNMPGR